MTTGPVSVLRIAWRGLTKRCARCGGRGLFDSWTKMKVVCPTCGLVFEREEGTFLGAFVINFAVTELVLGVTIAVLIATTLPEPPALRLSLIASAIVVAFPIAFYPVSKTLWIAIDLALHPEVWNVTSPGDHETDTRSDHYR